MTKNTDKRTLTPDEEGAMKSIDRQIAADDKLQQNAEHPEVGNAAAVEALPLTADTIEDRIEAVVIAASGVFQQLEQRALATNGKAYPLDYNFEAQGLTGSDGQPILDTGDVVNVNKFDFIAKMFTRAQCSSLDMLLRQQRDNIERQKNRIQSEIRFGRNAGADVAGKVERMADFLAHMHEQAAIIEVALHKAVETYALSYGEDYVPKEQAAQVAKARADSLPDATKAKLKALGIA